MEYVRRLFVLLTLACVCACFNFDLNFVDIIGSGSGEDYFGYSVLLQKGTPSSVLVGAPKANSSLLSQLNIKEPGVLYRCRADIPNSCNQFEIDKEGNTEHRPGDSRYIYKNKKDGGLLGATFDSGDNVGDPLVVCSPRWINDRRDRNGQHYLANGICYWIEDSRNVNATTNKLMPLLNAGKQGYTLQFVVKYYYAMGQVGSAVQYLENEQELLLGAPGLLSWRGSVVRYKILNSNNPLQQRSMHLLSKRQTSSLDVDVPNPVYINSLKDDNYYFGYAISSGRFKSKFDLWYVAGAPRADDLYGFVMLYEFATKDDANLIVHKKIMGEQLGAYFGGSVLSVDITNNEVDDLLVGAPTYFIETWDEGCVYFYKNDGKGNFENPVRIFGEKKIGGRFGTSIASIGDINQDLYKDVAISAPYEDGHGAVYIYLGSKNGLSPRFSQKISPKILNMELRGFGFGISRGVDIDRNLYNDIAIGAYKSGHVVLVKSRPVIKYFASLSSSLRVLPVNATDFTINYCVGYETTTNGVDFVDTSVQITMDPRILNNVNIAKTIKVAKNIQYCRAVHVMLKAGGGDFTNPFTATLTYKVENTSQTEFCANCAVTDPTDSTSTILNVPFANGCGEDNVCQPDLKISVNVENNTNSLVVGLLTTLKLNVRVENMGEPAYLSQIHMALPADVEILRISSRCEFSNDRTYHCLIKDVFEQNTYKDLVFDLDVKKLNPKDKYIFFNLTVDSKGNEVNLDDNIATVNLSLRLDSNIQIMGQSYPDQLMYVDKENKIIADILEYNHEFFIKNFGPSPVMNTTLKFYFPIELDDITLENKVVFDVYEPEMYLNNQRIKCKTDYPSGFYNDKVEGELSEIDASDVGIATRRSKRNSESQGSSIPSIISDLPLNRTLFINCTNAGVRCMEIICITEEVIVKNQFINGKFRTRAHIDVLQKILENKDLTLVSSIAEATVERKRVQNYISTLLIGSLIKEEFSHWIIIVSVISALIILGIVIFILYKLNFFNRPVREKLQNAIEDSNEPKDLDDDDRDCDEQL